jgi:hypothetical protein
MGRLHREQQASRFQNRGFLQQQKLVTYPDPNSDSYQEWVGEEVRDETAVMRSKEMRDVETQYCRLVQGMHCTTRAWPFRPCAAAKVESGPCRGPYGRNPHMAVFSTQGMHVTVSRQIDFPLGRSPSTTQFVGTNLPLGICGPA